MIGYKNTISGESSIMQTIRIPENTRNVILVMNLIVNKIIGDYILDWHQGFILRIQRFG